MKLSVIVPVFGTTPYIAECRAALASQTLQDFEVVECAPHITGPQNAGAARNAGLEVAKGEWIAFVDADDLPMPDLFAAAVAVGEQAAADVVIFDAIEFDNKTGFETPLPLRLDAGLESNVRFTSFGNCVWNKIFRAAYLREKSIRFQEITRSNDLAFCIEALARTDRIVILPQVLYRYRINGGGLQSTKSETPNCWREALVEICCRIERAGLLPQYSEALERLKCRVAGENLPGGCFSFRRIIYSIQHRGIVGFLKHAYGRLVR